MYWDKPSWKTEEPEADDNWEGRLVDLESLTQDIWWASLISMEHMNTPSFFFLSDCVTIDLTIINNSGLVSDTEMKFNYFYFLGFLSFHMSLLNIKSVKIYSQHFLLYKHLYFPKSFQLNLLFPFWETTLCITSILGIFILS